MILIGAAVLVVVVGLVFVGDAVGKTSAMPDHIVVDSHEAIEFCAEALPVEITATLSYDELRRVIRLHLEWVQAYHWSPEGQADGPVIFEEFDPLDYVMERIDLTRIDASREQAAAVIQAHSAYLQVVGAIHLDDPVQVEADLAQLPLSDDILQIELMEGDRSDQDPPDPDGRESTAD